MQLEFDLVVGDVIRVGDHTVMIVEIHEQEVTVKICSHDEEQDQRNDDELQKRPARPR